MKRICLPLFIGVGLALATGNSLAKQSHNQLKKHSHTTAKPVRINSKKTLILKKGNFKLSQIRKKQKNVGSPLLTAEKTEKYKDLEAKFAHHNLRSIEGLQYSQQKLENSRIHSFIEPHNSNFRDSLPLPKEPSYKQLASIHGVIYSSLASAGRTSGLSNELIAHLANIFAWDIDLATNLKRGDQFSVIYEKTDSTSSEILAAEFVTKGKTFTAIRFKDSEGRINYYSPEGKPMRKAFLSTPVDFIRISSGFDAHRRHPVLNRIRAHKGIDYAARTGTPVKAAGDGKVAFLGNKGGYGQVLIIEHGEHFETLYAHLADFKRGLESGDHVKQGEIIGYVGQTGLATGPHLHYEFRVDGVHRNPEQLNHQHSAALSGNEMAQFRSQSQLLLAQLYQTKARSLFAKTSAAPYN
jgi:murein DD-endopeptidase MepM/ murein hydrolase activator NlpD